MPLVSQKARKMTSDNKDNKIDGFNDTADDLGSSTGGSYNGNTQSVSSDSKTQTHTEDDVESISNRISRKESKDVFRLKIFTVLILIMVGVGVSLGVLRIMKNAEENEFESQYEGAADKILTSFSEIMVKMGSISALAIATSAHSIDHSTDWPFNTISSFAQRAGNARTASGALMVSVSPLFTDEDLPGWEAYSQSGENNFWIEDGLEYQERLDQNGFEDELNIEKSYIFGTEGSVDPVHAFFDDGRPYIKSKGPFLPRWQSSPVLRSSIVNEDFLSDPSVAEDALLCIKTGGVIVGGFLDAPPGNSSSHDRNTAMFATLQSIAAGRSVEYEGDPISWLLIPQFAEFDIPNATVVGVMESLVHWRQYFVNILPASVPPITVVLENECDGPFTYEIHGPKVEVVGVGDRHDSQFQSYRESGSFENAIIEDGTVNGLRLNQDECPYFLHVYPTEEFYESFQKSDTWIIVTSLGLVFLFTIMVFLVYDWLVERRQHVVLAQATQSTAIVSSLFPKKVRERLMAEQNEKMEAKRSGGPLLGPNRRLKTFLNNDSKSTDDNGIIADLFPECTVFFADIAGFTAWSSTREPAQVFLLLQTIYGAFDKVAQRRHVFKVETIGDCYLAVTGLPDAQPDHAVRMARFASECAKLIQQVTKELEVPLGPGTGNLTMRLGLHSGPVTAGVLKGDRARFQLFGDTVNTASRLESSGRPGKIQVSQATANLLIAAGKEKWVTERKDMIEAKGKGVLKAYWLNIHGEKTSSEGSPSEGGDSSKNNTSSTGSISKDLDWEQDRRVEWIVAMLAGHIKKIVAVRTSTRANTNVASSSNRGKISYTLPDGKICLDEVLESIAMPEFNSKTFAVMNDVGMVNSVEVPAEVIHALREYVKLIAMSYNENSFHNFDHACHVTMSVNKLLHRIVTADIDEGDNKDLNERLHNYTHGISSDPMAIFAIVFSALIHDVDHQGISNAQLAKEEPEMGIVYRNVSVAEQNSLDVAWDLLMSNQFTNLCKYIFGTQEELMRFRQLIVNVVLATDIFDKKINDNRRARWEMAFHPTKKLSQKDVDNLRATIVIEHIIQASDVCHTMQHWHVYQKWNKKLFFELHKAYKDGRMGADPGVFWYEGELKFFDHYIIPLAKKLKDCNVFGAFSDDYLNYASMNRSEWAEKGMAIVEGYKEAVSRLDHIDE